MAELKDRVSKAVKQFWTVGEKQVEEQKARGTSDQGARGAATGGQHLAGFTDLICDLLVEAGAPKACLYLKQSLELPGFFRPVKKWDVVVAKDGLLLAALEMKSHIGPSFGNNYNNRTEEAIGTATDLWQAFSKGKFGKSPRPWLGYLMLLEKADGSMSPVTVKEPHFKVFEEFRDASYARRYELLCDRLVKESLYNASCLLLSARDDGKRGEYVEPVPELGFEMFVKPLLAHVAAYTR